MARLRLSISAISFLAVCALLSGSDSDAAFSYTFAGPVDEAIWSFLPYSFEGNTCAFDPSEAVAGTDALRLRISPLPAEREGRKYVGACLMSRRAFGYGSFKARIRASIPSGTVLGFFLMNEWKPAGWVHKEIDFEFLGKDTRGVQLNLHRFLAEGGSAVGSPTLATLPFDAGTGFHEYEIRWEPASVAWFVDGRLLREDRAKVPDEPLNILLNFWIPDPSVPWASEWAGPFDPATLPAYAEIASVDYASLTRGRLP